MSSSRLLLFLPHSPCAGSIKIGKLQQSHQSLACFVLLLHGLSPPRENVVLSPLNAPAQTILCLLVSVSHCYESADMSGNVAALLSPIVFVPILTFAFGSQQYDWLSMKLIRKGDDSEIIRRTSVASGTLDPELVPGSEPRTTADEEAEIAHLNKVAKFARGLTVFMAIAFLVVWPMPMYGTGYVFSKKFFTGMFPVLDQLKSNEEQAGLLLESYGYSSARSVLESSLFGKEERHLHILSSQCIWISLERESQYCKDVCTISVKMRVEQLLRRKLLKRMLLPRLVD